MDDATFGLTPPFGLLGPLADHPDVRARGDGFLPGFGALMGRRPLLQGPPTIAAAPTPDLPSATVIPLPLGRPDRWRTPAPAGECGTLLAFTGVTRSRHA